MEDRIKAAVFGSFVADALSLGPHWVYNTNVIDKKFGVVDRFLDPLTSYHLITKYEDNFKQAMIANVMAGGDSAARGMLTGMVLGAYHGLAGIPEPWLAGLKGIDRINAFLAALEA
jgi:ADP-ribosylglycohydrolase